MELEVWSPRAFDQGEDLFAPPHLWRRHGEGWSYSTSGWQILLDESISVDPDDIPTEIGIQLAATHYLTRLTLEPGHAPRSARSLMRKTARDIADRCSGIVYDPQQEIMIGLRGRIRPAARITEYSLDLLTLNWWFLAGPLTTQHGAKELLAWFADHVPQFLPKRYGEFEPPKYRFSTDNIDHFIEVVFTDPFGGVWHTGSLFDVYYHPNHGPGWKWFPGLGDYGYAVPKLNLRCPASLLQEDRWHSTLQHCWRTITAQARPMYSDVRILRGYRATRNRLTGRAGEGESHPIGGSWRGLPRSLGLAVAVGQPYLDLWPQANSGLDEVNEFVATRSLQDWRGQGTVSELVGLPPDSLRQPGEQAWISETRSLPDGSKVTVGYLTKPTGLAERWPFPPKPKA